MKNIATKKLVLGIVALAFMISINVAFADGSASKSPYHNPEDTGINLDATLVLGAGMYGAGILMTSTSKAIQAKLNKSLVQ